MLPQRVRVERVREQYRDVGVREGRMLVRDTLGAFFPMPHNLLRHGDRYTMGFEGLIDDPEFGATPQTGFLLQTGSPAIDAGTCNARYHQDNVTDGKPDLGALEFGETIDDWREAFGHVGPRWINAENAEQTAQHRPTWPEKLDRRWGGLGTPSRERHEGN